MRASVVVSTYNRVHLLRRTLPALLDQTFPPGDFEVIVVVDASSDQTVDYLRSLPPDRIRVVVHDRNRGLAAARQSGLLAAQGDLVIFLDDDMVADRHLVAEHVAAHADGVPSVACGAVFLHPDSPPGIAADCFNAELGAFYIAYQQCPGLPWDGTWVFMSTSAPREVLQRAGGFDESFRQQREDVDLGLRLEKLGVVQRYAPAAVSLQIYQKTARDLVADARQFARGDVLLMQKNPDYRRAPGVARLVRGTWWKRALWQVTLRSPVSPELLLRPPFWLTERCRTIPMVGRMALRLLQLRKAVAWGRGVLDEMPGRSWRALASLLES